MNLVEIKKDMTLLEVLEDYINHLSDEEKEMVPTSAVLILGQKKQVAYHNHIDCDAKLLLGVLEIAKHMIIRDSLHG